MTVYISFSAEINVSTGEHLIALMAKQVNDKVDHVYLLMSSPGGQVMSGLTLYNVLKAMPFKLTTHNVGNVDSIANAIFLAGRERYACPHSTFMFHGVGYDITKDARLEQKDLQERLDSVLADQRRIGDIMTERTGIDDAEVGELFKEARTKDATFALEKGIVHDIRDVNIPAGASVLSLVFQR